MSKQEERVGGTVKRKSGVARVANHSDLPERHSIVSSKVLDGVGSRELIRFFVVIEYQRANIRNYGIIFFMPKTDALSKNDFLSATNAIRDRLVNRFAAEPGHIRLFRSSNIKIIDDLKAQQQENEKNEDHTNDEEEIVKEAGNIFLAASRMDASDIHIEIRKNHTIVKFRINGDLQFYERKTAARGRALASSIYNALTETQSGQALDEKKPQDALIDRHFNGQRMRFRLATIPADPEGFDMVLRTLYIPEDVGGFSELSDLGFFDKEIKLFEEARSVPGGIIIVAGTTGSGKSTTISNVLKKEVRDAEGKTKIITVEDPPEYFIEGATQIGIKRDKEGRATESFNSSIRGAMRSDPDIMMVGEVRDNETANLVVAATQTGHKVYTTVHASSALSIINRLENLGVNRETLAAPDFFAALVYQKLLKTNCPHCAIKYNGGTVPDRYSMEKILGETFEVPLNAINKAREYQKENRGISLLSALLDINAITLSKSEEAKKLHKIKNANSNGAGLIKRLSSVIDFSRSNVSFINPDGCIECSYRGISGRTVVAEVIRPDTTVLDLIREGRDSELEQYWRRSLHGKDVFEIGAEKVSQGIIDPWEYEDKLRPFGLDRK